MKIDRKDLCFYSSVLPERASARKIIDHAERMELGGVELMSFCEELATPDRAVARELSRLARSAGLALPCFSVGIDAIADPARSLERLRGYAEICSVLEIPYLHHTIALDFSCGALSEGEREKRFNTGTEIALELADFCAPLGVRTLIEDQGFVFNGVEVCDRLCRLSGERIGIVADVGNILFVNERPEDFIRAMGGRVCHAHLKDYSPLPTGVAYRTQNGSVIHDCEIGTGMLDFGAIESAFAEIGYRGRYSLEFAAVKDFYEVERVLRRFTD